MAQDTVVEERLKSKLLYKFTLYVLKIIPMMLAFCDIANTFLWLLGIDFEFLSYIGGVSFLTLLFLYLASAVFKFCIYHRMFLHYVTINNIISIFDYYNIIPVNYIIYLVTIGVLLFALLYLHLKHKI